MCAEELKELVPIPVWEVQVKKEHVGAGRVTRISHALDVAFGLQAVFDHMKLVLQVVLSERFANKKHIPVVVFGEKNLEELGHDSTPGSEKKNVEPTPGSLSAHILPP